jgi:hypothetical protein
LLKAPDLVLLHLLSWKSKETQGIKLGPLPLLLLLEGLLDGRLLEERLLLEGLLLSGGLLKRLLLSGELLKRLLLDRLNRLLLIGLDGLVSCAGPLEGYLDHFNIAVTVVWLDTSNRGRVTNKEAAHGVKFLFKFAGSCLGNFKERRILNKECSLNAFGGSTDGTGLCVFCL